MTAQLPDRVSVKTAHGHVEVEGITQADVEYALALAHAVTKEQLRARSVLASHINQALIEESLPLVSADTQKQVQRSATLRTHLLEEQGAETYASLAALRGTRESSVRTWASRLRKGQELFTVAFQGQTLIPRVQLTESGELDPVIPGLVRPLAQAGLDEWSMWAWLTTPTGLLSGSIPADVAATNVERARRAADRYAAEISQAQDNVA